MYKNKYKTGQEITCIQYNLLVFKPMFNRLSRFNQINIIILSFLIGAFASPIAYSGIRDWLSDSQSIRATPLSDSDQQPALSLQKSFINVYEKASPSVVFIRTNVIVRAGGFWMEFYQQRQQAGSGFIIDDDGFIVTNNHVIAGAQKIEVIFHDNTKTTAKLIGSDEASDIALIKVSGKKGLVPAALGDSDKTQVGQLAFALGAPFGLDRTFTQGVISAKQRRIDNSRFSRLQTDAAINMGNSGGPLLNIYSQVIGVNQSIFSTSGGSVGIGFAVPINDAMKVVSQLRKQKRVIGRPTLGVTIGLPSPSLREELKIGDKEGVVVIQVLPSSAAADAGLQEYDFIYEINSKQVKSNEELVNSVQEAGVGGKLTLKIMRQGKNMTLNAEVGEANH